MYLFLYVATFNTSSLKHKPKEEKILINLDNTFLKSVYNEFYIGQVAVDINKIEKEDLKKDLPSGTHLEKKKSSKHLS